MRGGRNEGGDSDALLIGLGTIVHNSQKNRCHFVMHAPSRA